MASATGRVIGHVTTALYALKHWPRGSVFSVSAIRDREVKSGKFVSR
jgi:hypothetical protein